MKPAFELYGEMLLAAGRAREAAEAFEQALLRTPQRTPSLAGLGAAAVAAGDAARARRAYGALASMPGAAADSAAVKAARAWLAANPN
jgi:thioredoxin-like negative regulator of GroEL